MKTKQEIEEKLKQMQKYTDTVPRLSLIQEDERISFIGTNGAIRILEWVLEIDEDKNDRRF